MDIDAWIRLSQVVVALFGIWMVTRTLKQRTESDNRAEWWRRYSWAIEQIENEDDTRSNYEGWMVLDELSGSTLMTETESWFSLRISDDTIDDEQQDTSEGGREAD